MGKAILFLRVSTASQELASQETAARKLAHTKGYTDDDILAPIQYKESAVKLEEKDRQGLQDLYATLEERTDIEAVFVTELSRLSRQEIVLFKIRDYLIERKIQLICENPPFELLDKDYKLDSTAALIFSIFGCFARQEAIEKKERFARGKEQKAIEGKFSGGNIPFGYAIDKERDNLIVIDPENAELVKEIFRLYESGISQPKLAKHYAYNGDKKITISLINNILNNERYTGRKRIFKGSSYARSYPIIISPEQFDKCRDIANSNNTNADKTQKIYYANHLIRCTECGCYFSTLSSKCLYRCYDAYSPTRDYNNYKTPRCTNHINISINLIDSLLWKIAKEEELHYILNAASSDKETYIKKAEEVKKKLYAIKNTLDKTEKKKKRILENYEEGHITSEEKKQKLEKIQEERYSIIQEQIKIENNLERLEELIRGINSLYGFDDFESIKGNLEKIINIKEKIDLIQDDKERSEIIHRHIQYLTVVSKEIEYEFGIGKRLTKARYISIWLHKGDIQYYYAISSGGGNMMIIASDSSGNLLEKIDYEYLPRFVDKAKQERRSKEKEERIKTDKDKYPEDKYIIGLDKLAEFLCFKGKNALHSGNYWVRNGVLKPALIEKYKGTDVFDKGKCIELLKEVASKKSKQAYHARERLKLMGILTIT